MASRTGLFPAATHPKGEDKSYHTGARNTNNNSKAIGKKTKPHFQSSATNFEVSSAPKEPHPTCEACSAKKTWQSFHSPANARTTFLKRKSELGFLTGQKPQKFDVIKRSQSNENLTAIGTQDGAPRSILKKTELRVQETRRHVQFNHKATDQASLRAKLNNWLKEKGKTPGSCHNLLKFGANLSAMKRKSLSDVTSKLNVKEHSKPKDASKYRKNLFGDVQTEQVENEDVHRNQNEVLDTNLETNITEAPAEIGQESSKENMTEHLRSMLDECLTLFYDGCSLEIVLPWLANMETSIPDVVTFAPFYVCKAKVLGEFPQMVLDVYTEAVRNNAQPSSLLADEMKAALSRWLMPSTKSAEPESTGQTVVADRPVVADEVSCATPLDKNEETPVKTKPASLIKEGGSTVKYKITTPAHRQRNLSVVTPVRRSVRLSGRQPTPGRRSDVVEKIVEISPTERRCMVFKMNPTVFGQEDLSDKLNSLTTQ